jgi:uncharacterized protein (DUF1501 family)
VKSFHVQYDRRKFLKRSAFVSLSSLVPAFLARSVAAADAGPDDRTLVVIQLDGGNDGLNTVVPFADELYAKYRKELRINPAEVLKLDEAVGLHPQMKPAADLFQAGQLAIVQGVGYPNPNRSHFESMAIWHHARLAADDHDGIGWLGRTADAWSQPGATSTGSIYVGTEAPAVALRGRRAAALSLENENDLKLSPTVQPISALAKSANDQPAGELSAFVHRAVDQSYSAAKRFSETPTAQAGGNDGYPTTKLGQKLRLISKLVKLDGGTRLFYASQTGYDTHSTQAFTHAQLLREFAAALKAFLDDLAAARLDERVVVLAFSEFGRRVDENASAGTDHGAAGPVFLAGAPVRGGVLNPHPSLSDLDREDLKMHVDFREVYAALLERWLKVDSASILGGMFTPFDCVRAH